MVTQNHRGQACFRPLMLVNATRSTDPVLPARKQDLATSDFFARGNAPRTMPMDLFLGWSRRLWRSIEQVGNGFDIPVTLERGIGLASGSHFLRLVIHTHILKDDLYPAKAIR